MRGRWRYLSRSYGGAAPRDDAVTRADTERRRVGCGVFVTGTDTECGKTEVSLGLMWRLQRRGRVVLGMKPVASGAEMRDGELRNRDALRLQAQGSRDVPYADVNPYAFAPAIAPHLAAQQAGACIDLRLICRGYAALAEQADWVVVEGVGGWRVPLGAGFDTADLALALGLPVLLVVGMRLGCLNHALLTVESVLRHGAPLVGWVANRIDPEMDAWEANLVALREWIPVPCLGLVPHASPPQAQLVAENLAWPP